MTVTIDLTDAEVRDLRGYMILSREGWSDRDWKIASLGDHLLARLWEAIPKPGRKKP